MMIHAAPVPGSQNLLKFVSFIARELHELRGFELPTMAILLHLDRARGGTLSCTLKDLGRLSGTMESIAFRLARILDIRDLICIEAAAPQALVLSLTPCGRSLLTELTSALSA